MKTVTENGPERTDLNNSAGISEKKTVAKDEMLLGLSCKPRALYKNKQPTEFIIYYFPLFVL